MPELSEVFFLKLRAKASSVLCQCSPNRGVKEHGSSSLQDVHGCAFSGRYRRRFVGQMSILRSSAVIGHVLRLRAEGFVVLRTARPRRYGAKGNAACWAGAPWHLALGAAGNLRVCSKRVLQRNRQGTHL